MLEPDLRANRLQLRHLTDINGLLRRSGFYDEWGETARVESNHEEVTPEALEYLTPYNCRLSELRRKYSELDWAARRYTQWSPEYVSLDLPLHRFRADCAFLWQQRDLNLPVHYLCTYLYFRGCRCRSLLDLCSEDSQFGARVVCVEHERVTRDRLDSVSQLDFLQSKLGLGSDAEFTILDIGAGYGRLAHRTSQVFSRATVVCVDAIAEATFICEFYLRFRGITNQARVVPLYDIHVALEQRRIDIATAINSFSECSTEAIQWWLKLLEEYRVPYLMVVPTGGQDGGRRLLNPDSAGRSNDFEKMILASGYKKVCSTPKYEEALVQQYGISPTHYHLFCRK